MYNSEQKLFQVSSTRLVAYSRNLSRVLWGGGAYCKAVSPRERFFLGMTEPSC